MVHLRIEKGEMQLEMRGSDDLIISELSTALIRMLTALEQSEGNPVKENLALLTLQMISKSEQ